PVLQPVGPSRRPVAILPRRARRGADRRDERPPAAHPRRRRRRPGPPAGGAAHGDRGMLADLYRDVRVGLRALCRRPAAALVLAVGRRAGGTGAAAAPFAVADAVLLRPLPYPHAGRVVAVYNQFTRLGLPELSLSEPEVADYRQGCPSLAAIAVAAVHS